MESWAVFLVLGALLPLNFSAVFFVFACCSDFSYPGWVDWCEIVESRPVVSLLLMTVSAVFFVVFSAFTCCSDFSCPGWVDWCKIVESRPVVLLLLMTVSVMFSVVFSVFAYCRSFSYLTECEGIESKCVYIGGINRIDREIEE